MIIILSIFERCLQWKWSPLHFGTHFLLSDCSKKNKGIIRQSVDLISLNVNPYDRSLSSIHIYVLGSILDFSMHKESGQKDYEGQSIMGINWWSAWEAGSTLPFETFSPLCRTRSSAQQSIKFLPESPSYFVLLLLAGACTAASISCFASASILIYCQCSTQFYMLSTPLQH